MTPLDWTLYSLLLVALLVIGVISARKTKPTFESYFLADRKMPWWAVGVAGGVVGILPLSEFRGGAGELRYVWVLLTFMAITPSFFAGYIGAGMNRSRALTGADWLQCRFGRGIGGWAALVSYLLLGLILCIVVAGGSLSWLLTLTRIDQAQPHETAMLLCLGILLLIGLAGGLRAVTLMATLIGVVFLGATGWSIVELWRATSTAELITNLPLGWDSIFGSYEVRTLIFVVLCVGGVFAAIGVPLLPWDAQRLLQTKNPRRTALSGIPWLCVLVIGICFLFCRESIANGLYLDSVSRERFYFEERLYIGNVVLVITALFISINAGASLIGLLLSKIPSARFKNYVVPLSVLLMLFASYALGASMGGMEWIFVSLVYSTLGMVSASALFFSRVNGYGYCAALLSLIVIDLFPDFASQWLDVLTMMGVPVFTVIVVSYLTPRTDPAVLREFYRQFRPGGFWGSVRMDLMYHSRDFVPGKPFWYRFMNAILFCVVFYALAFTAAFIGIRQPGRIWPFVAVAVVVGTVLYFTWYRGYVLTLEDEADEKPSSLREEGSRGGP